MAGEEPRPKKYGHRYSAKDKAWFRRLYDQLGNAERVAAEMGIGSSTAVRWAREAGLGIRRRGGPAHPGREEYHRLRTAGMSIAAAAEQAGVLPRTAQQWERQLRHRAPSSPAGEAQLYNGPMPSTTSATSACVRFAETGRFLVAEERLLIADLHRTGASIRSIAARLGRAASTISREIRRNTTGGTTGQHRHRHRHHGEYLPHTAGRLAQARRRRPKTAKLLASPRLAGWVQHQLDEQWSPEQISRRLVIDFPDDQEMRVCPETIYQAIYLQARGGLKRELQAALRTGRTARKPQGRQRRPRVLGEEMVMISERPAEVADRAVPGHWEGDLILGAGNRSAIATLVERHTRFTMLAHLPGGDHSAPTVAAALSRRMQTLPQHLRGSLTWDQGSEMAQHQKISLAAGLPIYFCDPASPWQRGSNENTNGLLRQYFPKGTDLSAYSPEDLELVADKLNGRPRKTLDWATPAERLRDLLMPA